MPQTIKQSEEPSTDESRIIDWTHTVN